MKSSDTFYQGLFYLTIHFVRGTNKTSLYLTYESYFSSDKSGMDVLPDLSLQFRTSQVRKLTFILLVRAKIGVISQITYYYLMWSALGILTGRIERD